MDAFTAVAEELEKLKHELMRKYTLTKYFLLHLLSEALKADEVGLRFKANPSGLLGDPIGSVDRERIRAGFRRYCKDLVIDLNFAVEEREANGYFDYKRVLKSPSEVSALAREVLSSYEKVVQRGRVASFGQAWTDVDSS